MPTHLTAAIAGTHYFDVVIRGQQEPLLLARVIRILAWQGVLPHELHFRAMDGDNLQIQFTAQCDSWRLTRLVANFQGIHGVIAVEACNSETGDPADPVALPAPAAR